MTVGESPYGGEHGGKDVKSEGKNTLKRPAAADGKPPTSHKGATKKRPSAAVEESPTSPKGDTPTRQRERTAGEEVTLDNMTKREKQKYDDAMIMSENSQQLSLMVVNLKQSHSNRWKEHIISTPNKELQQEWKALTSIGYGNQKVVNLG